MAFLSACPSRPTASGSIWRKWEHRHLFFCLTPPSRETPMNWHRMETQKVWWVKSIKTLYELQLKSNWLGFIQVQMVLPLWYFPEMWLFNLGYKLFPNTRPQLTLSPSLRSRICKVFPPNLSSIRSHLLTILFKKLKLEFTSRTNCCIYA